MNRPATALIAAGLAVFGLFAGLLVGVPLLAVLILQSPAQACAGVPSTTTPAQAVGDWDSRQVTNAAVIVSTGKSLEMPPWGYVVALATAMQESSLLNHANDNDNYPEVKRLSMALPHEAVGHDHDSVGLFQQRPIEGDGSWGTVQELMTPSTAAEKFYRALKRVDGWEQMRLTDAAQAVQHSGTPEAYQDWEASAKALAAHVLGLPNLDAIGGGGPSTPCGPGQFGPVTVGPNGWTQPLDTSFVVVAPYGQDRGDHLHAGVDIGGADVRGQPIRAVADGVVERVKCDSGYGTCDRDGWDGAGGCGWYVDIRHTGDIVTRYCHQLHQPYVIVGQTVTAGQVVGQVGSSGNSSGPHLHFEVHLHVPEGPGHLQFSNSVDPVSWMSVQGAPIPAGR